MLLDMAKKATQKAKEKPVDMKQAVIAAAFTLAQQLGWAHVTMADIAQESGFTLADLHDYFDDKADILAAYERGVTRRMLTGAGDGGVAADPRDALFDLLMDRFEILSEDRQALLSILDAYKRNPADSLLALPYLGKAMKWMLEAAGLETVGWRGAMRVAGLTGVYLAVLKVWMEDESVDLAKTMAAIDKNLARAQDWAGRFSL